MSAFYSKELQKQIIREGRLVGTVSTVRETIRSILKDGRFRVITAHYTAEYHIIFPKKHRPDRQEPWTAEISSDGGQAGVVHQHNSLRSEFFSALIQYPLNGMKYFG